MLTLTCGVCLFALSMDRGVCMCACIHVYVLTWSCPRYSTGDSSSIFTMQSGSKCFTYAIAVEEYNANFIHKYIGKEPSGRSFNSLFLNAEGTSPPCVSTHPYMFPPPLPSPPCVQVNLITL